MTMTATQQRDDTTTVSMGFWLYLMTDCLLFASLFATYAVLQGNTAGGPGGREIFDLSYVLIQTLILLTSSVTSGLALLEARAKRPRSALGYVLVTIVLGAVFVGLELNEFSHLLAEGHSWQVSGFLSAFFTLVGTHGLHITAGLIWAVTLSVLIQRRGLTHDTTKKLTLLTLFWHFLDIIWIFIFTFVYALGVVS